MCVSCECFNGFCAFMVCKSLDYYNFVNKRKITINNIDIWKGWGTKITWNGIERNTSHILH